MYKYFLIIIILSFVVFTTQAEENKKFFGVFTVNNISIDGCKIVNMGNMLKLSTSMKSNQKHDFDNSTNYLNALSYYAIDDLPDRMKNAAIKNGFNAVIGYQLIPMTHFNGFGSSVINGLDGVGYGVIVALGTPIELTCGESK
jgi:hypothetical protein